MYFNPFSTLIFNKDFNDECIKYVFSIFLYYVYIMYFICKYFNLNLKLNLHTYYAFNYTVAV